MRKGEEIYRFEILIAARLRTFPISSRLAAAPPLSGSAITFVICIAGANQSLLYLALLVQF